MNAADPDWAERALGAVIDRVGVTAEQVGERFPLFADPDGGRWTTSARGSWTGGFWAGLLWLRALVTGDLADRTAARECTRRLAGWVDQDAAVRGMILWYGTALADGTGAGLRERAARRCLAAFEPAFGVVPWGGAFGGPRLLARADGVPGLVPLLARSGEAGLAAARAHLTLHLELCLAEEPPRPAWAALPGGGWRGCDEPEPGWSRTVGWLLLGVADALAVPGLDRDGAVAEASRRLAALRLGTAAAPVPVLAGGLLDTSAAAIEAVAALKLAALAGTAEEREQLAVRARVVLRGLCERHLTSAGGSRPAGMLLDGCYDVRRGLAVRHELVWGDFFLAFGLAVLTGLVGPFAA
ncbi:sugar ABC transporter permease [Kitasatospora sp. NPDC052896]|uniref:sugar ABC transporter permease n=1 Tax=Kitasatospora sp. NPDC052896 TaxID=3364061 RepID=UPI0037CA752E